MKRVAQMEPLAERMADPSEMAQVAVFLGSNESSYLTGLSRRERRHLLAVLLTAFFVLLSGAQIAADGGLLAVNGLRSGLLGVSRPEMA